MKYTMDLAPLSQHFFSLLNEDHWSNIENPAMTPLIQNNSTRNLIKHDKGPKAQDKTIKNRISAQVSRDRKRQRLEELEAGNISLERESKALKAQIREFEFEKDEILREVWILRGQVNEMRNLVLNTIENGRVGSRSSSTISEPNHCEGGIHLKSTSSAGNQLWVWRERNSNGPLGLPSLTGTEYLASYLDIPSSKGATIYRAGSRSSFCLYGTSRLL